MKLHSRLAIKVSILECVMEHPRVILFHVHTVRNVAAIEVEQDKEPLAIVHQVCNADCYFGMRVVPKRNVSIEKLFTL